MVSQDIIDLFLLKFDINGNTNVGFETDEIEGFLNSSLSLYYNALIKAFEINEQSRKALSRYVTRTTLTESTTTIPHIIADTTFYDVTTLFANGGVSVEEHVIDSNGVDIKVKPISLDYFWANIDNKYKKPSSKLVWRIDVSDTTKRLHELVHAASVTLSSYTLTHIKDVPTISNSLNTEILLPDSDINNIVDIAVAEANKALHLPSA